MFKTSGEPFWLHRVQWSKEKMTSAQQALGRLHFLSFIFRLHRKFWQRWANCKKKRLDTQDTLLLNYPMWIRKSDLHLFPGCEAILSLSAWLVQTNWWSWLQQPEQSISMFVCLSQVRYSDLTSLIKTHHHQNTKLCLGEMQRIKQK